jgi:hypothetical protein
MSFNILAVREVGSAEDPLYPAPGEQADSVQLRAEDGQPSPPLLISELTVREIPLGSNPKRLLRVRDISAKVWTTDWRIVLACSKYDKGGGWRSWSVGAIPVTLAANTVSKVRASRRRAGKMLVGQVPYKSLVSIGHRPRSTPIGHDQLRLGTVDPTLQTFRGLLLDLALPRQHSGVEVARQIAGFAAGRRLDSGEDLDEDWREHLSGLRQPAPLQTQAKQFTSYFLGNPSDRTMMAAFQGEGAG